MRLSPFSAIPGEEEVLLEPPTVFKVISCAKFNGVVQVVLESVASPLKYLSA